YTLSADSLSYLYSLRCSDFDSSKIFFHFMYFTSFFIDVIAPTAIYTLSLHDALPIFCTLSEGCVYVQPPHPSHATPDDVGAAGRDRKSTRLNSSHQIISYAVFCLKKKTGFARLLRQRRVYFHAVARVLG